MLKAAFVIDIVGQVKQAEQTRELEFRRGYADAAAAYQELQKQASGTSAAVDAAIGSGIKATAGTGADAAAGVATGVSRSHPSYNNPYFDRFNSQRMAAAPRLTQTKARALGLDEYGHAYGSAGSQWNAKLNDFMKTNLRKYNGDAVKAQDAFLKENPGYEKFMRETDVSSANLFAGPHSIMQLNKQIDEAGRDHLWHVATHGAPHAGGADRIKAGIGYLGSTLTALPRRIWRTLADSDADLISRANRVGLQGTTPDGWELANASGSIRTNAAALRRTGRAQYEEANMKNRDEHDAFVRAVSRLGNSGTEKAWMKPQEAATPPPAPPKAAPPAQGS